MTLANGRPYLAIPGPSVMPDRVLAAMHRAAPNIYEGKLPDLVETLWPDLRRLAGTTGHVGIWIANGHGAWEAANANLFSRGDKALVLDGDEKMCDAYASDIQVRMQLQTAQGEMLPPAAE